MEEVVFDLSSLEVAEISSLLYSPPMNSSVFEAIASDFAPITDPVVASSLISHLSFFADQDVQFPPWKPASNAYVFGNFSEGVINLGADSSSYSSCLVKNSVTQQIDVPLIIDQFFGENCVTEVTQILLSIKEFQLSWLGLWNFPFNWMSGSNLLLEIDGSWCCPQVVCENVTLIGDSFESILLDPGGFRSCTQGVCIYAPMIDRCSLSSFEQVQFELFDKRIDGASNLNIYQDAMVFVCCNHCSEALEFSDKLYMLACEVINRLTFTLELSESAYALIYAAISEFEILHKTNMLGLSNGSLVGIATICVFRALSSLTLLNASTTIVIENNEDDPIDQATVWNSNTALQLLWHTLSNFVSVAEMQLSQSSFCFNIKTYFVVYFGTLFGSGFNGGCSTSKSLSACSYRDLCDSEFEAENAEFLSWLSEAKVSEQLGFPAHERLDMLQNLVKRSGLGASQGLEMGLILSKVLIVLALLHILCFYFLLFLEAPPVHVKMQQAH